MKILNEEEILKFAQKLAYSQNISSKKNSNDKSLQMLNDDFSYISSICRTYLSLFINYNSGNSLSISFFYYN